MNVAALMYHDVTPRGAENASGFPGGDAARYKLTPDCFDRHLIQIELRAVVPPLFTFDDGGASAERIADALARHGWRGYFFVTTRCLNRPGFVDARTVTALHAGGHVIGSHSHTHPLRMARCPPARLRDEWSRSVGILSDLLGEPVTCASVPGGDYSDAVASAAAVAGIRVLFTSEPTSRERAVDGVRVLGRFPILASTRPRTAAALAAGSVIARARWAAAWQGRRLAKRAFGTAYHRARGRLLGASPHAQWGDDLAAASEDPS